ncbi:MAG: helix-turn-helix transcriptional regulator [Clostridia bacterium]
MAKLKSAIAKNIIALRKAAGLTQIELAEKLNYSDKSVSKWERCESLPDITVIQDIADLFGVTVDYMLVEEHPAQAVTTGPAHDAAKDKNTNHLIIALLSASLVWLIATIVFVVFRFITIEENGIIWLVYVYAIPVTCVVLLIFNAIWGKRYLTFIILSLLIWSILSSVYLLLLPANNWYIFLIGIPAQLITVLWANLRPRWMQKSEKRPYGK